MSDPPERLDELAEFEAHLAAALRSVREERAHLEALITPAQKRARSEVERINFEQVMAERARIEAETECDRMIEISIRGRRVLREMVRDPRRWKEIGDLERAGIIDASGRFRPRVIDGGGATGHFLPTWQIDADDGPDAA